MDAIRVDTNVDLELLRGIRLLCVDVDGVLTDAGMYYGPDGEVLKKFNTRDGMGLARASLAGRRTREKR